MPGRCARPPFRRADERDVLLLKKRVLVEREYRVEPHKEARERVARVGWISELELAPHERLTHAVEHPDKGRGEQVVTALAVIILAN